MDEKRHGSRTQMVKKERPLCEQAGKSREKCDVREEGGGWVCKCRCSPGSRDPQSII